MTTCTVRSLRAIRAENILEGDFLLLPVSGRLYEVGLVLDSGSTMHVHRRGGYAPMVMPKDKVVRVA